MMRLSANELEQLARKAAIGAGVAPGYAANAARALLRLTAAGLDVTGDFLGALDDRDHGRTAAVAPHEAGNIIEIGTGTSRPACVLSAGAAARDFAATSLRRPGDSILVRNLPRPLLLMGWLAQPGNALAVTCTDAEGHCWEAAVLARDDTVTLVLDGDTGRTAPADLALRPGHATPAADETARARRLVVDTNRLARSGASVDHSHFAALRAYFDRTLVPDSEASRQHGAGAGVVDRD